MEGNGQFPPRCSLFREVTISFRVSEMLPPIQLTRGSGCFPPLVFRHWVRLRFEPQIARKKKLCVMKRRENGRELVRVITGDWIHFIDKILQDI